MEEEHQYNSMAKYSFKLTILRKSSKLEWERTVL